jgi:hypothetical protein
MEVAKREALEKLEVAITAASNRADGELHAQKALSAMQERQRQAALERVTSFEEELTPSQRRQLLEIQRELED